MIIAECSISELLMVCDTDPGRKHLSKGVVLVEGREHTISLVLVIFLYARISLQFPWQELIY